MLAAPRAPQGGPPSADDDPTHARDWTSLPHDLLAAILRSQGVGKPIRLVCRRFRSTHDASATRATLHLEQWLLQGERRLPRAPASVRVAQLDVSRLVPAAVEGWEGGWDGLAATLQAWPVACQAAPGGSGMGNQACGLLVELDAGSMHFGMPAPAHNIADLVAGLLRSPAFAPGGLQALDLGRNHGVSAFAAALPSAPQLSALHALNLVRAIPSPQGAAALCAALAAATQIRSLVQLNLGWNELQAEGVAALAACLVSARHLSTLQHLLLSGNHMSGDGACALAAAIATASLRLTALDVSGNGFGDAGAVAWAGALQQATCLADLAVLSAGCNGVTEGGMTQLAGALQAATHMTAVRRLSLLPNNCGASAVLQLLAAAPQMAAALEHLSLQGADLSSTDAATDALAARLLASLQLPRLTSLDLSGCRIGSQAALCGLLCAATQLSRLQALDMQRIRSPLFPSREGGPELVAALAAATHFQHLRRLGLPSSGPLATPEGIAGLLQATPHLRTLTAIVFVFPDAMAPASVAAVSAALALLPRLRSLAVCGFREPETERPGGLDVGALLGALRRAPCLEQLQELTLSRAEAHRGAEPDSDAAAMQMAAWLKTCTRLSSLTSLDLGMGSINGASCTAVGAALAGASHLSCLRELDLTVGFTACCYVGILERQLAAASHLAGVPWQVTLYDDRMQEMDVPE